MWSAVNPGVIALFDTYLWPFQGLSATWQVLTLALPTAVLALVVYRYTSNQAGIAAKKNKITAHLLELVLYRNDPRVLLSAQGQVFRHAVGYVAHGMVPLLVMVAPIALVLIQVESRYAFRDLQPGEATMLSVVLAGDAPASDIEVALSLAPGLIQETPPMRIDSSGEINWRLRADRPGEHRVGITIDGETVTMPLIVGTSHSKVSPSIYRENDIRSLLYPAASPLKSDCQALAIHLDYPRDRSVFAGLSTASWLLFGASLLFAFALRGVFGVTL